MVFLSMLSRKYCFYLNSSELYFLESIPCEIEKNYKLTEKIPFCEFGASYIVFMLYLDKLLQVIENVYRILNEDMRVKVFLGAYIISMKNVYGEIFPDIEDFIAEKFVDYQCISCLKNDYKSNFSKIKKIIKKCLFSLNGGRYIHFLYDFPVDKEPYENSYILLYNTHCFYRDGKRYIVNKPRCLYYINQNGLMECVNVDNLNKLFKDLIFLGSVNIGKSMYLNQRRVEKLITSRSRHTPPYLNIDFHLDAEIDGRLVCEIFDSCRILKKNIERSSNFSWKNLVEDQVQYCKLLYKFEIPIFRPDELLLGEKLAYLSEENLNQLEKSEPLMYLIGMLKIMQENSSDDLVRANKDCIKKIVDMLSENFSDSFKERVLDIKNLCAYFNIISPGILTGEHILKLLNNLEYFDKINFLYKGFMDGLSENFCDRCQINYPEIYAKTVNLLFHMHIAHITNQIPSHKQELLEKIFMSFESAILEVYLLYAENHEGLDALITQRLQMILEGSLPYYDAQDQSLHIDSLLVNPRNLIEYLKGFRRSQLSSCPTMWRDNPSFKDEPFSSQFKNLSVS